MVARRFAMLVLGVVSSTVLVAACGSEDDKKSLRPGQAGASGEGGASAGAGGTSQSDAGQAPVAGNAGSDPTAGDAGIGGSGQGGGAGGPDPGGAGAAGAAGSGGSGDTGYVIGAYVSPSGSDASGDGTLDAPFETLTKAASVLPSGGAIGLLDGNHIVDYFVQLPDGVALVGVNPGGATIGEMSGFNGSITFLGDAVIDGLRMGNAVNMLNVPSGIVTVKNTQFGAHGDGSGNDAAFVVGAAGRVVLEAPSPAAPWFYEPGGGRIAQVNDGGSLSVTGGVFEGAKAGSLFFVYSGRGDMSFVDVSFVDCDVVNVIGLNNGGIGANDSKLLLDGVIIDNSGSQRGIFVGFGTPVVTIKNSTIDTRNATGISIEADLYATALDQTVTIENSVITGNNVGILSYYYGQAVLTLVDTNVDANNVGIRFMFTDPVGSSLDMTGGSISDNGGLGFDTVNEANKPSKVKLRGVTVAGNADSGLLLYGNAGAVFDLGTVAEPGNNVLQNPGAMNTNAAIVVNTPSLVSAIGNTWIANQQGASAQGTYVPAGGNYTEVTGPVTLGQNYRIVGAAQKLRL